MPATRALKNTMEWDEMKRNFFKTLQLISFTGLHFFKHWRDDQKKYQEEYAKQKCHIFLHFFTFFFDCVGFLKYIQHFVQIQLHFVCCGWYSWYFLTFMNCRWSLLTLNTKRMPEKKKQHRMFSSSILIKLKNGREKYRKKKSWSSSVFC